MDLKIIEKKEEPLLSRTKILSQVDFDAATPSAKEVRSKMASSLKANENLVVIRNIYTDFGFKKADVTAYLYKDEKEMGSIEPSPKKQKEGKAEKPEAKEEKPKEAEAGKEEKPKEAGEAKEDKSKEEKAKENPKEQEVKEEGKKEAKQ